MKHPSLISTERFLLISFVVCIAGSLLIYHQIDRQYSKSNLVTHSYIVKVTLNQLLLNLTEAETDERGYLLTHDPAFLKTYQQAIQKARVIVNILDSLTLDNDQQQTGLAKLRQAFNNNMLPLQASVLLTASPSADQEPVDDILNNTREILDNLRIDIASLQVTEDGLLRQRVLERNSLTRMNPYFLLLTFLLVLVLIVFVYLKLKKETLLRIDSENNTAELEKKDVRRSRELADLNEQLSTRNQVFLHAERIALIGSYTWTPSTGRMQLSDNLYRLLGYEPGEADPSCDWLIGHIHPAEKKEWLKNAPSQLEALLQPEAPCRFITRDGIIKYFRATGSHFYTPEGEVIIGTFQDITRDIELRQKLESNDNFIRSILEIAPNTISIFDFEKHSVVFSSHPAMLGFEGAGGGGEHALIHPEDREAAGQYLESLKHLRDKEVLEFEYRVRTDNNGYNYLLTRNTPYKRNNQQEITQTLGATIDITEKIRAQHEVKAKTEALLRSRFEQQSAIRFKTLADSMPQIVWTADPGGEIDYYNQRWYSYTRLPDGRIRHDDLKENIHPDDRRIYFESWERSLKTGNPFQVEFRFRDHNHPGQYCWLLAKALAIYDQEGSIVRWHGTFTDINDLKLAQLSIQHLVKEKEDFIHIASHELKTPVTSLKGSIQLLKRIADEGSLPEDVEALVDVATRQVNKLSRMVGNLLDVAKMDANKIELMRTNFLLQEAVTDSLEQVRVLALNRAILTSGPLNIPVHANKERIEQVIANFLSNAIKYSPDGSDILLTSVVVDSQVKVSVSDHGIGIPPSKQPFVFDRFFRVEESSDQFSGLGLGLYISAEIIAQHEGRIGVTSEPGKGSTFWFTIPMVNGSAH